MEFDIDDMREFLEREAALINRPEFISDDPVQFPRRFESLADIEIVALLSSAIAWGNRKMICRDADRMLALMEHQPYKYMMERGYEELDPDMNIHRTFFARNLSNFLSGMRGIYERHGSLADFARANRVGEDEAPAWRLVELVNAELDKATDGIHDSRCLPGNLVVTALKRVNMALRWLCATTASSTWAYGKASLTNRVYTYPLMCMWATRPDRSDFLNVEATTDVP